MCNFILVLWPLCVYHERQVLIKIVTPASSKMSICTQGVQQELHVSVYSNIFIVGKIKERRNQPINLGENERKVTNGGSNTVLNLWVPQAGTE